jgi:membrane-associated phospholipid phosphatase
VLTALGQFDRQLFYAVNHGQVNRCFDWLMPFLTSEGHFKLPLLLLFIALLVFGGKRGRIAALLVIPLITISDQTSSNLVKHAIGRVRPCGALPDVRLLAGCSGSFAMPSSHAANSAAAALHFALFYPRLAVPLALLALAVGYSRIYVGVHYPADVLVGFLIGSAAALLVQGGFRLGNRWWERRRARSAVAA